MCLVKMNILFVIILLLMGTAVPFSEGTIRRWRKWFRTIEPLFGHFKKHLNNQHHDRVVHHKKVVHHKEIPLYHNVYHYNDHHDYLNDNSHFYGYPFHHDLHHDYNLHHGFDFNDHHDFFNDDGFHGLGHFDYGGDTLHGYAQAFY